MCWSHIGLFILVKFPTKVACSCLDTILVGYPMFFRFQVDPNVCPLKVEIRI